MTILGTADPSQFGQVVEKPTADRPDIDKVVKALKGELDQDYAPPHVKRHAHPKMHGCVLARFKVHEGVDDDLRHGIFARAGQEFRAWVRFSNAFGIEHDLKFENRGLGIKVLDVTGEHLPIPGGEGYSFEDTTQDFVLSTHDAFPLKVADGYEKFAAAARKGLGALVVLFVKSRNWRGLFALIHGGLVEARNPLAIKYNSQTAYRLGPHVVKVRARPHFTKTLSGTFLGRMIFRAKVVAVNAILGFSPPGKFMGWVLRLLGFKTTPRAARLFCERYIESSHYLRTVLEESLAREDATFEIGIQRQTSKRWMQRWMPSDDPTVRWREWLSPFRAVATLTIPRQVFWPTTGMPPEILRATKSMVEDGENMSFNPWHGLVEHEPLGHINLARGEIYAAISKYRHCRNAIPQPDPSKEYDELRDTVLYGAVK